MLRGERPYGEKGNKNDKTLIKTQKVKVIDSVNANALHKGSDAVLRSGQGEISQVIFL